MRKVFLLFTTILLFTLSACSISDKAVDSRVYYRPAIGPTVEKEQSRDIKLDGQNELKLDVQDGNITLIPWEGDYVQVKETKMLKAPGSRKNLESLIDEYKSVYQNNSYEISISTTQPEKQMAFARLITNFEIKVPKGLKAVKIKALNGSIGLSGFEDMSSVDLKLETGTIRAEGSKADGFSLTVKRGDIIAEKLEGKSNFNILYGNAELKDIKGEVQLKSTSGRNDLKYIDGVVDCDISRGSLDVSQSFLKAGSSLYASNGDITAEITGMDKEGSYSFMASAGSIKLSMPGTSGFNLKAKSGNGRVVSDFKPAGEEVKPDSRELSGKVGNGGPDINIYIDRGDATLSRSPV